MAADERAVTPKEQLDRATTAFNQVLINLAQQGQAVKISVRSFPSVGNIAKCPQIKAEIQSAT